MLPEELRDRAQDEAQADALKNLSPLPGAFHFGVCLGWMTTSRPSMSKSGPIQAGGIRIRPDRACATVGCFTASCSAIRAWKPRGCSLASRRISVSSSSQFIPEPGRDRASPVGTTYSAKIVGSRSIISAGRLNHSPPQLYSKKVLWIAFSACRAFSLSSCAINTNFAAEPVCRVRRRTFGLLALLIFTALSDVFCIA